MDVDEPSENNDLAQEIPPEDLSTLLFNNYPYFADKIEDRVYYLNDHQNNVIDYFFNSEFCDKPALANHKLRYSVDIAHSSPQEELFNVKREHLISSSNQYAVTGNYYIIQNNILQSPPLISALNYRLVSSVYHAQMAFDELNAFINSPLSEPEKVEPISQTTTLNFDLLNRFNQRKPPPPRPTEPAQTENKQ
eukprot:TRINITY_DN1266_c0_g1_i1.p1 TRINITY_DN1266_c0_g1~~TRINITY_DN1266_c0_g1_i1.p1  ORF type:complete len:193 (-),score=49.93 TRINITY_DN1266_c0_g1_i1:10-588(-)